MRKFLRKLFKYETMDGDGVCSIYLERWHLLKAFGCSVYLHHFLGDDWALDPHDHPRRFISIGLWGHYVEESFNRGPHGVTITAKRYSAPWIRSFPAEYQHRIKNDNGFAWTLVIVLWKSRKWGFIMNGKWVHWREYVDIFGSTRKSC